MLHQKIETFLTSVHALYQLEPKNLPKDVLHSIMGMPPEELFKTCTQLAVLKHNIPSQNTPITLSGEEILVLAEGYLKELISYLKHNA